MGTSLFLQLLLNIVLVKQEEKEKGNLDWKGRNKPAYIHRWHNCLCRKSQRTYSKSPKINKFLAQSTKLTKAEKLQLEDLINNLRNPQLDVNQFKEIMTTFNGIENNAIQAGRATSNFFDAIKNDILSNLFAIDIEKILILFTFWFHQN